MDKLRKSLRDSFRRKKDSVPECNKPHQWQADEAAVRSGTCNFSIKYLGCVEVFESRGMQVCEEALKVLRNSRRRAIKGTLYVTGDGLRVVDDETKGLLVDQTIEKVSFCAPDRNHEKGFSYICRDGTTRRWMCHGFLAVKDTGERLSHAVGCAFAVCLEKKQKRDKESVVLSFDPNTSTFTRTGSFRQSSLTERMQDPQDCKPSEPPPIKPVKNPFAIERPHAPPVMVQRQGSFRGFTTLNQTSPFKRQLSLRLNELPSTLERQKEMSLDTSHSFVVTNGSTVAPIMEASPVTEKQDTISAMCQQLSQGLSFLSTHDDPYMVARQKAATARQNNGMPWSEGDASRAETWLNSSASTFQEKREVNDNTSSHNSISKATTNQAEQYVVHSQAPVHQPPSSHPLPPQPVAPPRRSSPNFSHLRSQSLGCNDSFLFTSSTAAPNSATASEWPQVSSSSFHVSENSQTHTIWSNGNTFQKSSVSYKDPFDAEWAALASRHQTSTNPFAQHTVKAFEVQM